MHFFLLIWGLKCVMVFINCIHTTASAFEHTAPSAYMSIEILDIYDTQY